MAMDPNMLARLAIGFGGRMMQGSQQPGGTFGSGLGAGFGGVNQDMMQFQQQEQMQKMRAMQMQQMQQEQMQAAQQQKAQQQIGMQMQQQGALGQPQQQFQQNVPATNNLPAQQLGGQYRPVPQEAQMMGQALETGDLKTANFLQAQQQQAQKQQQLQQEQMAQQQQEQQQQAVAAEKEQYRRQQNRMKMALDVQDSEYKKAELDIKRGKAYAELNPKLSAEKKIKVVNTVEDNFRPLSNLHSERKKMLMGGIQLAAQETGTGDTQLATSMIRMYQNRISNFDFESSTTGVDSIPGRVMGQLANWTEGEKLTPKVRSDMLKAMHIIYDKDRTHYNRERERYNGMLDDAGLDKKHLLLDNSISNERLNAMMGSKPEQAPQATQAPVQQGKVLVTGPDGKQGYIPSDRLDLYLRNGYRKAQ